MKTIILYGKENIEIRVSKNNIFISNSYLISKWNFLKVLKLIREKEPNSFVWKRGFGSLITEWAVHNFLYFIKYKREETKSVDLNIPKWYIQVIYFILGIFCLIFIK